MGMFDCISLTESPSETNNGDLIMKKGWGLVLFRFFCPEIIHHPPLFLMSPRICSMPRDRSAYPFKVMLADFGLAKEIDESNRSNSMCGTTEYMAPEILLSKGNNKNADWWSVGILLYEMLTGKPPFTHPNRKKLQEKIINEKVKLLPRLSGEAHSLLKVLLQKEPSARLGSGSRGDDDVKGHKWFRTINWKKLESRGLEPKFKPDVSGEDCTENFDKCWTAMPLYDSPAPTPTTGCKHQVAIYTMGYIGAHGINALHRHKYSGVDHSYVAKYVLQPFWSRFVTFFPLWMP